MVTLLARRVVKRNALRLLVGLGGLFVALPAANAFVGLTPAAADETAGTVISGGILSADSTWTAQGSPYYVSGPVQVAAGATLTIEAGAQVVVQSALQIQGGLTIAGDATDPVSIKAHVALVRGIRAAGGPSPVVTIQHANITGPGALVEEDSSSLTFTLTDSQISDVSDYSYLYGKTLLERDVFTRVNAIELDGDSGPVVQTVIRNNRFRGFSSPDGFQSHWGSSQLVALDGPMRVDGNVFEAATMAAPRHVPRILEVARVGSLDASGNYFGSTDPQLVGTYVTDKNDDLDLPSVIGLDPLLADPPAEVPVAVPTEPVATWTCVPHGLSTTWQPAVSDGGSAITGYTLTVTPDQDPSAVPVVQSLPADATSAKIDGLDDGAGYVLQLTAQNASGSSAPVTWSASTPTAPGTAPGVPVAYSGNRSAWVTWREAADYATCAPLTDYTITVYPVGLGEPSWTVTVPGNVTQTKVDGLVNGHEYVFTVTAANAIGSTAPSARSAAVTAAGPPLMEQTPVPHAVAGDRKVTLSWQAPQTDGTPVALYVVNTLDEFGFGIATMRVPATSRSAVVAGLTNGHKYRFTVTAASAAGDATGALTGVVVPAMVTTPGKVSTLRASRSGRRVVLTWTAPPANGRPIIRFVILDKFGQRTQLGASTRRWESTRLRPGTYSYRIRAVNAVGAGPLSDPARIRIR